MDAVLDPQTYTFGWLSLPFVVAAATLAILCVYVVLIMGNSILRAAFLLFCLSLLPSVVAYALAAATLDPAVATTLFRLGSAPLVFTSASILLYEMALSRQLHLHRALIGAAYGTAVIHGVIMIGTDWYITDDVWTMPSGMLHFRLSPATLGAIATVLLWFVWAVVFVRRRATRDPSERRRVQLRNSMRAFAVCTLALSDMLLGFGIGWYPTSWLWLTAGGVLLLRSLTADDLIHGKSVDVRAPARLVFMVATGAGAWLVWRGVGMERGAAPVLAAALVALYLALRGIVAALGSIRRRQASFADTALERVLDDYARRVPALRDEREIGKLTVDTVKLALGSQNAHLLLSSESSSWSRLDGVALPEDEIPHPFTWNWYLQHAEPITRERLSTLRLGELRPFIEQLFDVHAADVIVPLVNRDDMVGMLLVGVPAADRSWRREELELLTKVQEHLTAGLVYARMYRLATQRVELDRQLELAAAVQSGFVPKGDLVDCGNVVLAGLYAPASQCGGDWWSVHKLPDDRVLVLVGDVTGHGVAAAMVTAAAKGCYDVVGRLMADDLDLVVLLELLDGAVRRVGASRFHMTCFATLLDPARGEVVFANAGHVVPYLCRLNDGGVHLGALVARGNPLGAGDQVSGYTALRRALEPGDVLVWYTDGIVECSNREREPFGDRRMQRLLRKIDGLRPERLPGDIGESARPEGLQVRAIRDHIVRAVATFQDGEPAEDDITLVVAQVT